MKRLQRKLPSRIFISSFFFIGSALTLCYGIYFVHEKTIPFLAAVIASLCLAAVWIIGGINNLTACIEYDDEKLVAKSFCKETTFFYKDLVFFGKKGGAANGRNKPYYWVVRTKEGTFQLDIPVSCQSQDFFDFTAALKNANPSITIKV